MRHVSVRITARCVSSANATRSDEHSEATIGASRVKARAEVEERYARAVVKNRNHAQWSGKGIARRGQE